MSDPELEVWTVVTLKMLLLTVFVAKRHSELSIGRLYQIHLNSFFTKFINTLSRNFVQKKKKAKILGLYLSNNLLKKTNLFSTRAKL